MRQRYWKVWSPEKWALAQQMQADHESTWDIAEAVGLSVDQVHNKFAGQRFKSQRKPSLTTGPKLAADLAQDRDARAIASYRRTQTQVFFGDPPPGYSALDQKRAAR